MSYGVNSIHEKLCAELENYIRAQYFGKSPLLLAALKEKLRVEGVLHREPYIESSPAYKTVPNGFSTINLPDWLRQFFLRLGAAGLGVYLSPFKHQIQALEATTAGRDLFVATGTGSGKTECFMLPLLSKLAVEAHDAPAMWSQRGVRAMVMYPMNALVSDQIGRLRRLIGDSDQKFMEIFRDVCGADVRRPQFGMYTGRTPYPGSKTDKTQDRQLAATLKSIIDSDDKDFLSRLIADGKIPSKAHIAQFLAALEDGRHVTDAEDAELITRFEMQKVSPDILITNYSMLEYMLMRPRESKIWSDTRQWLAAASSNKLLFVIDEAHMYKGSAGGEVALLLRRLMCKLGIGRDRVQFILTTASMPDDRDAVEKFFRDLTASSGGFDYLTGEREELSAAPKYDIDPKKFLERSSDEFEGDEDARLKALNEFWSAIDGAPEKFPSLSAAYAWLYDHLIDYRPFAEMIRRCRGEAVSFNELASKIFPSLQPSAALKAVGVMLSIAPLARNDKDAVLFPARMHMLFRGLKGVYACTNPDCPHAHVDGALKLGEIFLSDGELNCPHCGSVVYEIYNDRRCGALFFKGYVLEDEFAHEDKTYLWRYSGQIFDEHMREVHLFIPPDDYVFDGNRSKVKECFLDVRSGFIYFGSARSAGRRRLYYSTFEDRGRLTFYECPQCRHQLSHTQLTSFGTRGNQSFFNLIQTQFHSQPAVAGKRGFSNMPNEGRKVLLFSDSRQRAATLARDMSRISDDTAARQLFSIAAAQMESGDWSMQYLYDYFCLAAVDRNVRLFDGEERENFSSDCKTAAEDLARAKKRGRKYCPQLTLDKAQSQMQAILLRMFCGGYNTLYDSAVAWLEPAQNDLEGAVDKLADYSIDVSDDEFRELFNAWIISVCDQNTALGDNIPDAVRLEVRKNYGGYGLEDEWQFSTVIRDIMGWGKNSSEAAHWRTVLQNRFLRRNSGGNFYVDISRLRARFDPGHQWHRCERCKELTPYLLKGRCPTCGSSATHILTDVDLDALKFWRRPIEDAVNGAPVRVIDTEEHTAQLSHKDQRDEFWSKTEDYELRFQDFLRGDQLPVDILSSTTTMEVGIDIGSLVAIGLRNIPPMRENYQQRAGRAGRRGASLSTIVTFCEDGPHDTLYFNRPEPMFRGDPRKPWIDVESEKLLRRHLSMIIFQDFLAKKNSSLDSISAAAFLDDHSDAFKSFALDFKIPRGSALLPKNISVDIQAMCEELFDDLTALDEKKNNHPEMFGVREDGSIARNAKSLLDALYEEGIIPTYSFPKNVVSTYVVGSNGRIIYRVERGLDIAISECAPGRAIVVDKKTYQIGGIYYPGSEYRKSPASRFIEDKNYVKELLTCRCGWFGLAEENHSSCPFCGNKSLSPARPMLRPWGFAPKNATSISEAQLTEEYSTAQPPEYSTLPEHDEMIHIDGCKHIRMAARKNQRIIMLNKGAADAGFVVCKECGAAVPNLKRDPRDNPLKGFERPYKSNRPKCCHADTLEVNLGYDFITDMLVLEFALDGRLIDTRNGVENLWLDRAAQSVAEAFRLVASNELDIDFGELVTGYRLRRTGAAQKTFVDVYIYDNLSSGAGYSIKIASEIGSMLERMKMLLSACDCATACNNCLKHYRNQYVHGRLDRRYGLQLLDWGTDGRLAADIPFDVQKKYLESLGNILSEYDRQLRAEGGKMYVLGGGKKFEAVVYPAMRAAPLEQDKIYICDSYFKYAKPYALNKLTSM